MKLSNEVFNDSKLRPALESRIRASQNEHANSVVIEELGICRGQVRIDMALVNGNIHGYEIKSDRDSLTRLRGQVDLYSKVLDYATLVIGERHLVDAIDVVPQWWGILQMFTDSPIPSFFEFRPANKNPQKDPRALVELIWRDEALEMLDQRNIARGFRDKPREFIWNKVCEIYDVDEISSAVRNRLKTRAKNRVYSQQL